MLRTHATRIWDPLPSAPRPSTSRYILLQTKTSRYKRRQTNTNKDLHQAWSLWYAVVSRKRRRALQRKTKNILRARPQPSIIVLLVGAAGKDARRARPRQER